MGAVATTHKQKYREPFGPVMGGVEFVRFDDVADLRAKFNDAQAEPVCAICIEAVQGEGGVRPVSKEFFAAARELCDSTGALLLADEIQSGMGRTGEWFAYQHYGILPDITTVAKPMANGLPMGAMLCTEEAARAFTPGMHGSDLRRRAAAVRGRHRGDRHHEADEPAGACARCGRILQAAA